MKIKRAYDKPDADDGVRILVDGLWPRGLSKAELKIEKWEKEIAPSKELRNWYGHEPEKWPEFRKRFRTELAKSPRKEALERLTEIAEKGDLTLVFGTRDAEHSNAAVIAEMIEEKLKVVAQKQAKSSDRSGRSGR
ncbi:MAG TPA: DUF488 family protein [Terriglobia bacterium]|nr:DUF488 family protein [Terriglobia bacterium]